MKSYRNTPICKVADICACMRFPKTLPPRLAGLLRAARHDAAREYGMQTALDEKILAKAFSRFRRRARLRNLRAPLQHLARAIESRRPHHAAAGVRARAAQKQSLHRRPVARPPRHGPHHKHLVQTHFTMENIAAGDAKPALQVERRQNL